MITFYSQNPTSQTFAYKENNNKKLLTGICTGAVLLPLIPIIDGDSFKSSYKNKTVMKMTTGLAAIGGAWGLGKTCSDVYIKTSKEPEKNRIIRNTICGALVLPALLFVNNWASQGSKIARKWYYVSALAGAGLSLLISKINNKYRT